MPFLSGNIAKDLRAHVYRALEHLQLHVLRQETGRGHQQPGHPRHRSRLGIPGGGRSLPGHGDPDGLGHGGVRILAEPEADPRGAGAGAGGRVGCRLHLEAHVDAVPQGGAEVEPAPHAPERVGQRDPRRQGVRPGRRRVGPLQQAQPRAGGMRHPRRPPLVPLLRRDDLLHRLGSR